LNGATIPDLAEDSMKLFLYAISDTVTVENTFE
jgi:hypothetical protein